MVLLQKSEDYSQQEALPALVYLLSLVPLSTNRTASNEPAQFVPHFLYDS